MALQIDFAMLFFSVFFFVSLSEVQSVRTFNVRDYGAVADGRTDNRKAFIRAWTDACNRNGVSIVYVPKGVYMLGAVEFSGPCKSPIIFSMNGHLKAPMGASSDAENWIGFQYVNNLAMKGGGTLDGQGPSAWFLNDCQTNPSCKQLISDSSDAITSTHIRILHSKISTGDECVAILSGSSKIDVSNVHCGPGHGISIGSLGKYQGEKNVHGVSVRKCIFRKTDNGVRIKTWESPIQVIVSNLLFQDIFMDRVRNPIIIDQTYCPLSSCNQQTASPVQIRDVTYRNMWALHVLWLLFPWIAANDSRAKTSFRISGEGECLGVFWVCPAASGGRSGGGAVERGHRSVVGLWLA
ncbi:CTC-interacting domain 9 [Hibiscus syriacus]|uniref:CTC-interacting domain 9 n=1 Tax=Hibiscus syriacus TaxID=106335 RepID=A0A6A3AFM6_HIBSY|nr:CTC-interacting domain 9 [Hibiscus syriacus]